ncbi:hypothetical protein CLU81_4417 [Flavobacterium sp. 9]|nr:hypothetical protein CLU81_4417 [Flavobacterium sp. 9]
MSLGEIYFYVLTGLICFFSFFIGMSVEDIKLVSFFKKALIVCFLILILGLLFITFNLSYLSVNKTIYLYSLPILFLLINRILFWINNRFFGEPFIYAKGRGFLEGFWYDKVVDEKNVTLINKIYYFFYSALHMFKLCLTIIIFKEL